MLFLQTQNPFTEFLNGWPLEVLYSLGQLDPFGTVLLVISLILLWFSQGKKSATAKTEGGIQLGFGSEGTNKPLMYVSLGFLVIALSIVLTDLYWDRTRIPDSYDPNAGIRSRVSARKMSL